jgi:virginiamycin A acetyltransferase
MMKNMPVQQLKSFLTNIYKKLFHDTKYFDIHDWSDMYHDFISVGEHTYGYPKIYMFSEKNISKLTIGKYCSIAPEVAFLLGGDHRKDWFTTFPYSELPARSRKVAPIIDDIISKSNIYIGNDVWIGYRSIVLSGTTIGDGVIIAAGTVVTSSEHITINGAIPPYSIIAGNPPRIIGYRFSQEVIEILLQIQWWDWTLEKIEENIEILYSNDIAKLKLILTC